MATQRVAFHRRRQLILARSPAGGIVRNFNAPLGGRGEIWRRDGANQERDRTMFVSFGDGRRFNTDAIREASYAPPTPRSDRGDDRSTVTIVFMSGFEIILPGIAMEEFDAAFPLGDSKATATASPA